MRSSILDYVSGLERRLLDTYKKKYPKVALEYTERPTIDVTDYGSVRCTNSVKGSDTGSFFKADLYFKPKDTK